MPSLVATTSALARKPCMSTHYVRTNNCKHYKLYIYQCTYSHVLIYVDMYQCSCTHVLIYLYKCTNMLVYMYYCSQNISANVLEHSKYHIPLLRQNTYRNSCIQYIPVYLYTCKKYITMYLYSVHTCLVFYST